MNSSCWEKFYSTILDEEQRLALTDDDFVIIQWKMDKIYQKLNGLYRNWQVEYKVQ